MSDKAFEVLKYGDEILIRRADKIENITEELHKLTQQMAVTMYEYRGIGLAANQIGKPIQLAVVDLSMGENPDDLMILINPEIIESEGKEIAEEGCLSLPKFSLPIGRKTKILLKAIDINGKEIQKEFEDFPARVIQHEIDHLNGKMIVDHVSSLKRQLVRKEIKKLVKNGEW